MTKSIQKLEEELGGLLIIRDGKNTRLTELGHIVSDEFSRIIESEKRSKLLASEHLLEGNSLLKVGISNCLGPAKFTDFFSKFLEQNSNTQVVLHQIDEAGSKEAILSGVLDACICAEQPTKNHKIKTTSLFDERIMVAFARNDRLARKIEIGLNELSKENYFDHLNCSFRADLMAMIEQKNLNIRPLVQTDREDWIQKLVAAGNGLCVLGEFSAVVPGIRMRPLKDVKLKRTIALSIVFGSSASPAVISLEKLARNFNWDC